jgi:EPS-associated MarR family transcriptional regulator
VWLHEAQAMIDDETRYQVLRLLEMNPHLSQRDVARALDVSLGKINYCLRALIQKGWIKVSNFKNSRNKAAYMYLLTPQGIEQKSHMALRFLHRKVREYEELKGEIRKLRREAKGRE